jgi:hypothetical protein
MCFQLSKDDEAKILGLASHIQSCLNLTLANYSPCMRFVVAAGSPETEANIDLLECLKVILFEIVLILMLAASIRFSVKNVKKNQDVAMEVMLSPHQLCSLACNILHAEKAGMKA